MNAVRQLLKRIREEGSPRPKSVRVSAMGGERVFDAYDVGDDTYVLERGIGGNLGGRPSVLVAEKSVLKGRAHGWVMTISTGNHAVTAFPLLDGRFWRLSNLPPERRGETLMRLVVCANVVGGVIELSQREVSTETLVRADNWLRGCAGLNLPDVVMGERNADTLDYYRQQGQEWRVKPLAWTDAEMRVALLAARKRISTKLRYYHSSRGVHLLSFSEFARFVSLAESEPEEFVRGLREMVSVYEGHQCSFARMAKYRGHHEIEFFGLRRGVGVERLVPGLEKLMESIALGRIGQLGVIQKAHELEMLYESLLTRPEFADETSREFVETLYMYITGEIYAIVGEGSTPAFDDRRTALPGATFVNGRAVMHPGADERTEVLLSNLRGMMSKDELIEYANVYELRAEGSQSSLGKGATREVVYKTCRRPLENSLIEKRLSRSSRGYGSYMLARIGALRSLGFSLSDYYLMLKRRAGKGNRMCDYYIRRRCEGESLASIPASYYCSPEDVSVEEKDVVLSLAMLMGDAAAQNMAMKKFDPKTNTPLFGIGKEIYEFDYDIIKERIVPKRVSTCSIRGSFGWPDLSYTDENLRAIGAFYLQYYAHSLKDFQRRHTVPMAELADRFMSGFEYRTHAMAWQLSVMRDRFEAFAPEMPAAYNFAGKWRFLMWSLERQERRLAMIRKMFFEKVRVAEDEDLRNSAE